MMLMVGYYLSFDSHLFELLYLFEMQTAYTGAMLNIDTFNQPGVEGGKNATYALFGRQGYESTKEEMNSARQKKEDYICR